MSWEALVPPELPDFDKLWNYGNPEATEAMFRSLLPCAEMAGNEDYCMQLYTQIARTYGLRGDFDKANEILDEVEAKLTEESVVPRIRYLLERGRTHNSQGEAEPACALFLQAWELACRAGEDYHAIDAAHMLAISCPSCEQLEWNAKAMAIAEESLDPRARKWLGALYNNSGMTHLDAERYKDALKCFEKGLEFRRDHGGKKSKRIAKWCVAHTLRRMGEIDKALRMQRELEMAWSDDGKDRDGFVFEEIAECLLAQGDEAGAREYFQKTLPLLQEIRWLKQTETARLERIEKLAQG